MQSPKSDAALVFDVAGARFGLDVEYVREVLPLVTLQPVPDAPPVVAGMLASGAEVIPVIRLERLLRLAALPQGWNPTQDLHNRIVVAKTSRGLLAWICDPNAALQRYGRAERTPLPPAHSLNNCAEWVIPRKPPEPSIVLLNPERLLLEEERVRLRQLQERAQERIRAMTPANDPS